MIGYDIGMALAHLQNILLHSEFSLQNLDNLHVNWFILWLKSDTIFSIEFFVSLINNKDSNMITLTSGHLKALNLVKKQL